MQKYDYVECEEGASQYDDCDFKEQNIVLAIYVPAIAKLDFWKFILTYKNMKT